MTLIYNNHIAPVPYNITKKKHEHLVYTYNMLDADVFMLMLFQNIFVFSNERKNRFSFNFFEKSGGV